VDVGVVLALCVSHQEGDVIADVVDEVVYYEAPLLRLFHLSRGVFKHLGVDVGVARVAAYIGFYY
jgi:hypothetical protein